MDVYVLDAACYVLVVGQVKTPDDAGDGGLGVEDWGDTRSLGDAPVNCAILR